MTNDFDNATPANAVRRVPRQRLDVADPREDRLPPHSLEGEQGVLGCCLLDAQCIDDARATLPPEAFYDLRHRNIYAAAVAIFEKLKGVDLITLQQFLRDAGQLEAVGGLAYLSSLPDCVPSAANLPHYLGIVRDKFLLRRIVQAATEAVVMAFEPDGKSAREVAGEAERLMLEATATRTTEKERTLKEIIRDEALPVMESYQHGTKMHMGPGTGFNYFDNMVPGLIPGGYYVLAGRPGTGKSALMLQMADFVAGVAKEPVHLFTLEMSSRSLALRAMFQKADASYKKFLNGRMIKGDIAKLTIAVDRMVKLPFTVDDLARATIEDIECRTRRLRRQRGVRVFFLDYLQLLRSPGKRWPSRNEEMADISMRLVALAKETQTTFFVLAQMNRASEMEPHRIPRLSDLRDSGQVEQDADLVSFLYYPKVDPEKPEQMKWLEHAPEGKADTFGEWKTEANWQRHYARVNLFVAKHRHGATGDCALTFIKDWVRFVDTYQLPKDEPEQETEN